MSKMGNIGEWSELYVFLKLLADGALPIAGESNAYALDGIVRKEDKDVFVYSITENRTIDISKNGKTFKTVPRENFASNADILLGELSKKQKSSFPVAKVWSFAQDIGCKTLKAGRSGKSDISIIVDDIRSSTKLVLGFSIKSKLGAPATLLNASHSTNITYKLTPTPNSSTVSSFESEKYFEKKFTLLKDSKIKVVFQKIRNSVFNSNLTFIDSKFAKYLAEILLEYYAFQGKPKPAINELISNLYSKNPSDEKFIRHKIKEFLMSVALGMMPSSEWDGEYDATGGYIIVEDSGELECLHFYNRKAFRDYLFENTRFETPSTSKHGFGSIYKLDMDTLLDLNVQIRFR